MICVHDFPRGEVSVYVGVMEFELNTILRLMVWNLHAIHIIKLGGKHFINFLSFNVCAWVEAFWISAYTLRCKNYKSY